MRKVLKYKLFLLVRILLIEIMFHNVSSCLLYAQTNVDKHIDMFHNWSKLLSPEKVYLHTDKDVYFATDTIWFSGYVENASYASEFDESNYIYVELITDRMNRDFVSWNNYAVSEPEILSRVKLKCSNNSFQGHIAVPEMNSTGRAIIRAYYILDAQPSSGVYVLQGIGNYQSYEGQIVELYGAEKSKEEE